MTPPGQGIHPQRVRRQGRQTAGALLAVVGVAVLCALPGPVWGQINPFRGYNGPVMTKSDHEQAMQAAEKLLHQDAAKVGASESWSGEGSGNSGTVSVLSAFDRNGAPCRSLRSDITYKNGSKRRWTLNVCRVGGGDWKLV